MTERLLTLTLWPPYVAVRFWWAAWVGVHAFITPEDFL